MNYKFPTITNISEVRKAINGRDEFIEVQKHDYIVFNYAVVTPDTFPKVEGWKNAILRECRGLIFDLNGNLIRRPYHKFFNLNEREETLHDLIYWDEEHDILEKLDGSMIAPFMSNGVIRWGTKMGITELTQQVEEFVEKRLNYTVFAFKCIKLGLTPIFEWCSNKNRIVISYPEDNLVLTAIRENTSGEYASHEELQFQGDEFNIPTINTLDSWHSIKDSNDSEGVVLRFFDGHMLKVKSDWYVDLHKIKEAISTERYVIKMIFSNQIDDILPKLQDKDKEKILAYSEKVTKEFTRNCVRYRLDALEIVKKMDRKTFALTTRTLYEPQIAGYVFKVYDNPNLSAHEYFSNLIVSKTGNNSNLKSVAFLYGNLAWDYHNDL